MRTAHRLAALLGLALLCVPACATKVDGQLMLAVQTDMALPKDIDRIRIEVTYVKTGAVAYQKDFDRLGENESIRLPATLGFVAPKDPSTAIKVRVIASRGSDESVRVLREVVTTVPVDRTATLPISIEFLCNGSGEAERDQNGKVKRDPSGNVVVKNTCPDGRTCVAGTCEAREVPSEKLPDYQEEKVFGGGRGTGDGICFDTAKCFAGGTDAKIDLDAFMIDSTTCTASAGGDINVALRTQGGGICGPAGCFVALDADSDAGFRAGANGTIKLPPSVCAKVIAGEIVGVVTSNVGSGTCQKKQASIPTCGPWSASGQGAYTPPDPKQPTLVAPGQVNPAGLALGDGNVYWTSRGTFDQNSKPNSDGTVKVVPFEGGQPAVIAGALASPHGIVADEGRYFILWTNAGDGQIMWAPFVMPGVVPAGKPLLGDRLQPEGIAVHSGAVYWTELASHRVYRVDTEVPVADLVIAAGKKPAELAPPNPPGNSPRGIVAAKNAVCFTYEDKLMTSGGVVACSLNNQTLTLAQQQRTPRAIAMSVDASGNATSVYWANFDAISPDKMTPGGAIFKVDLAVPDAPMAIAQEDYPAGLAVDPDGTTLYWTSRSRGAVMVLKQGDPAPAVLVKDQKNPGAIVATTDTVFWINEGTAGLMAGALPDGAIMKVAK